jgi:hypothetical protein
VYPAKTNVQALVLTNIFGVAHAICSPFEFTPNGKEWPPLKSEVPIDRMFAFGYVGPVKKVGLIQAWKCFAPFMLDISTGTPPDITAPSPPENARLPQLATVLVAPQLSLVVSDPQFNALRAQNARLVSGTQFGGGGARHTLLLVQELGAVQAPQDRTVLTIPQLSMFLMGPQFLLYCEQKFASLSGAQPGMGIGVGTQPPLIQVADVSQVPQFKTLGREQLSRPA